MSLQEDIIVKLLDFLSAPSATTGALFAEKEQVCVRCENLIGFDVIFLYATLSYSIFT